MAAIFCRKCGAESPADSLFCMKCGTRLQGESGNSSLGAGAERDALVGQRILEYRIEAKLGEGGMGAVYLARHEALDQEVAIKVLRGQGTEDERTRFLKAVAKRLSICVADRDILRTAWSSTWVLMKSWGSICRRA